MTATATPPPPSTSHSPTPPPVAPPAAAPAPKPRRPYDFTRTKGRVLWFVAIACVVLAVAAFASGRAFNLGGDGGVTVQEPSRPGSSTEPRPDVTSNDPVTPVENVAVSTGLDQALSGRWFDATGNSYDFWKVGDVVGIEGRDVFGQFFFSTEGVVVGDSYRFDVYDAFGFAIGGGQLSVGADGRLVGSATFPSLGVTSFVLTR